MAELSSCDRSQMAHKAKSIYYQARWKKFANPWIRAVQAEEIACAKILRQRGAWWDWEREKDWWLELSDQGMG